VTRQKPKRKITLLEAQRRRIEALERWFGFIKGRRAITPDNFNVDLLVPTFWALGGHGHSSAGAPSARSLEVMRQLIVDGFKKISRGRAWTIETGNLAIIVTAMATSFQGAQIDLGLFGIAQLLRTEEWRIGACAWCRKDFLRKKQGEYCSARCSQFVRTKRVRDKRWKSDEVKARKAHMTVKEWRAAKQYPCPKCGAITRLLPDDIGFKCWKCDEIVEAKFGEETAEVVPADQALELFRDLTAGEAREVFAQMLGGGQRNLVAKYLDGDPLAKAKVEIIQERILAAAFDHEINRAYRDKDQTQEEVQWLSQNDAVPAKA
jgi:hypothetical protein